MKIFCFRIIFFGLLGVRALEYNHERKENKMDNNHWITIAPAVAVELWGKPKIDNKKEMRWGNKGSKVLYKATGRWCDFETGEKGGVIELVQRELSCDRDVARVWLRDKKYIARERRQGRNIYRVPPPAKPKQVRTYQKTPCEKILHRDGYDRKHYQRGRKWWESAERIPYGRDFLLHPCAMWVASGVGDKPNIWNPLTSWPDIMRWHPKAGVIIASIRYFPRWVANDPIDADYCAFHAIALDGWGRKRLTFGHGQRDKDFFGPVGTGFVFLGTPNKAYKGGVCICEGVADALAIYAHYGPCTVIATLTTFAGKFSEGKHPEMIAFLADHHTRLFVDRGKDEADVRKTEACQLRDRIKAQMATRKPIEIATEYEGGATDPAEEAAHLKPLF